MRKLITSLVFASLLVLSTTAQDRYGLLTITGTFFQTQNSGYLQTINDLNATSYTNASSVELAGLNYIHTYKGSVYITNGDQARVEKYNVAANGSLSKVGTLVYPAGSTKDKLVTLLFAAPDEAYTYAYGGLKLYKFDPSTMTAKTELDLSVLRNSSYTTTTLTSMIKRGDYLYIGVAHFSGFTSVTGPNQAQLAIVDTKTNTLVKTIIDQRTITLGYGNSNVKAFVMDENEDLYFSSSPTYQNSGTTKPTGVLRIKKDATEFDQDYFFDLYTLMGNHANLGLNYYQNGKGYSCCLHEEKINPLDPFSGATDAIYRYWSLDLKNKTGNEISDLPYTKAYVSSWMQKIPDGRFMLPIGTANGDAIWMLNPETNTATQQFTVVGQCFGVFPLNQAYTGIANDQAKIELKLYPNPASEMIIIDGDISTVKKFSISTLDGKLISTGNLERAVNIQNLDKGMYLFQLYDVAGNIKAAQTLLKN